MTQRSVPTAADQPLSDEDLDAIREFLEEDWNPDEIPPSVLLRYVHDLLATVEALKND